MRKRHARGCLGRVATVGLVLLAVLVLVLTVTHQGRVAAKTVGLMVEVFPSAPVYPLRVLTDAPVRTQVSYAVGQGETTTADLYRPAGEGVHGALVFYIGVGPELRNPNVVRIAEGLARAGVAVLIPVSPNLSRFRVVPEETRWVVGAFEYLSAQRFVDPERVGFFAVSAGGSLVAVAAQHPRIAGDIELLLLFGTYYDAPTALSALTLRSIEVDGRREPWRPEQVSIDVFRDVLLPTAPPADRPLLRPLLEGRTTAIPRGLSPESVPLAELAANRDPRRVPALLRALPGPTKRLLREISPRYGVERIRAELFLLHDRDDHIAPFTESVRFYKEASGARSKHLTVVRLFRHVEPEGGDPVVLLRETARLYGLAYRVLLLLA